MSRIRLLELLGLHANATREDIKSRYRELARKFHPDVNGGDERSHARFRAIVAAAEELLSVGSGDPARLAKAGTASPAGTAGRERERRIESPARPVGLELDRRRDELRSRLEQRERTLRRAQQEVRDGDAKALAARGRGNEQMARHFERRAEADRSQVYALFGEISDLEHELLGLESEPHPAQSAGRPVPEPIGNVHDSVEGRRREVQRMHEAELASLQRRYVKDH